MSSASVGRLLEDVRPQEPEDPLEGVAPVLAALPAMALVVVPVDLVGLALDLERLDHPLGHQRDDALVLATVQEQQRRLDPLGSVDRGAAPEELRQCRVVGRAHHLEQVQASRPVAVAEALRDLGIAVEVDAGREHRGLLDERAQDHVAAIRPAEDREAPVGPGLFLRPSGRRR